MQCLFNPPSAFPTVIEKSIRDYLEDYLVKDTFHLKGRTGPKYSCKAKEALTKTHLAQFINSYNKKIQAHSRDAVVKAECFFTLCKWSELIRQCRLIKNSTLTQSKINQFFLGEGICTGNIIEYFSDFFSSHFSPEITNIERIECASPFPICLDPQNQDQDKYVKFFPFIFSQEALENYTRKSRFLQAAYKVAYALKKRRRFHGICT